MSVRPRDTSKEAWAIATAGLRAMTPAERIGRATSLTILAHSFALAQIRKQHPNEDERRHRMRLAARYLDAATMKALGFVDDKRG